ncbi:MAG: corrinoid protein, partial [Anaerolineales bacterium]|nr:corrinoid protein [Anaerolineales bacterium]
LAQAIVDTDPELARTTAKEALANGVSPLEAVEQGLSKGMSTIGDLFGRGEVFLPELLLSANAFNEAMQVLKPELEARKQQTAQTATVVLGTVQGDLHSIGKNIVATLLETSGFKVVDLGVDRSPLDFVQEAAKANADVIALSCLMTTTMPSQKAVIDVLKEMKQREKYLVVVGGAPTSQKWADEIGADGYGQSAVDAVALIKRLVNQKK